MADRVGKVVTFDDQVIRVTFSGDTLRNTDLPRIVGIKMQMDGDADYSPLKLTTASIELLAHGIADISDLFSANEGVTVEIFNESTKSILFRGFIVPNSFNQAITGINDVVTIECVDRLGYAKYIPYEQVDEAAGFAVMKLNEVALRCLSLIGLWKNGDKLLCTEDVQLARGVIYREPRFLDFVEIGENSFFTSTLPDNLTNDYRPVAMSCEEVLAMIAESMRLTWISQGPDVILFDPLGATFDEAIYYNYASPGAVTISIPRTIDEEALYDGSINISTLSTVAMTEVEHEMAESIPAIQDPFDAATLVKDGDYKEYYDPGVTGTTRIIYVPLRSKIYDVGAVYDASTGEPRAYSQFVGWIEDKSVIPETNGVQFVDNYAWGHGKWNVALKLYDPNGTTPLFPLLRRKYKISTPVLGYPRFLTKYADRTLHIAAEVVATSSKNEGYLYPAEADSIHCKLLVSVIVGGLYYSPHANGYVEEKTVFTVEVFEDGTAQWNDIDIENTGSGIPIPNSGAFELVIYNVGESSSAGWDVAWLKKLEVDIKENPYTLREEVTAPRIERVGHWARESIQNIKPPLDLYYSLAEPPLGVSNSNPERWEGKPRLSYYIGGESLGFAEYAHRLANMGDRIMYEVSLRDEGNRIAPADIFTCSLWRGRKVVAGYTKNIIDNNITVKLI